MLIEMLFQIMYSFFVFLFTIIGSNHGFFAIIHNFNYLNLFFIVLVANNYFSHYLIAFNTSYIFFWHILLPLNFFFFRFKLNFLFIQVNYCYYSFTTIHFFWLIFCFKASLLKGSIKLFYFAVLICFFIVMPYLDFADIFIEMTLDFKVTFIDFFLIKYSKRKILYY